jgi:hypothetical protein
MVTFDIASILQSTLTTAPPQVARLPGAGMRHPSIKHALRPVASA